MKFESGSTAWAWRAMLKENQMGGYLHKLCFLLVVVFCCRAYAGISVSHAEREIGVGLRTDTNGPPVTAGPRSTATGVFNQSAKVADTEGIGSTTQNSRITPNSVWATGAFDMNAGDVLLAFANRIEARFVVTSKASYRLGFDFSYEASSWIGTSPLIDLRLYRVGSVDLFHEQYSDFDLMERGAPLALRSSGVLEPGEYGLHMDVHEEVPPLANNVANFSLSFRASEGGTPQSVPLPAGCWIGIVGLALAMSARCWVTRRRALE